MNDVKYICVEGTIFIFQPHVGHDDMADMVTHSRDHITSAGFVAVGMDGRFACYGESVSLDVKADAETDTMRVNRMFGNDI